MVKPVKIPERMQMLDTVVPIGEKRPNDDEQDNVRQFEAGPELASHGHEVAGEFVAVVRGDGIKPEGEVKDQPVFEAENFTKGKQQVIADGLVLALDEQLMLGTAG